MNGEVEKIKCAKCRSLNPVGISHCKFCHNGFAKLKTFIDKSEIKRNVKRSLLIVIGGLAVAGLKYVVRMGAQKESKS